MDGGFNDGPETLLVDGHLNGDVGEGGAEVAIESLWCDAGVELCVLIELVDGAEKLKQLTNERLEEEEARPQLKRHDEDEGETGVATVYEDLNGNVAPTETDGTHGECKCEGDVDGVPQADGSVLAAVGTLNIRGGFAAELGDADGGALLLVTLALALPDHFHQLGLDLGDTGKEVTGAVVPDDELLSIGDEGGELMLLAARKVGDIGQDLETETVGERDKVSVGVHEKELDDFGVDGHGDLADCISCDQAVQSDQNRGG